MQKKYGHVYIRVSSGEQAETGNSIENQRSQCREYAARHGITIQDVYVDAGISGRSMKRPELLRLQAAIQNGEHIIAYSVSRLSRSVRDFIALVEWGDSHSLTLHTVKEAIDTKSAHGSFLTLLFSALSQLEANLTQERMAELNTRKIRRGETTKAPPFGYRSVKYQVGVPARLVPDPTEQGAITRMFDLRCQNQFKQTPLRLIAEKLTEEGHHPRRSAAFTVESIRQIMVREYEFRMRVHGTLSISVATFQRYVDLCMPFIVPMTEMENYVVMGKDGRQTYNGQYEDTTRVVEKVQFFSMKNGGRKKRSAPIVASALDVHLLMFDREREAEKLFAHLTDQEVIIRRGIAENEARDSRRLLEQIIASQIRLESSMVAMRSSLADDLKMAEVRYRIHVEEAQTPNYDEREDSAALELRLNVMQLKRRLAQCSTTKNRQA
jgi:DNA invertase Pin-like site-specific DNA recombinase